MVEWNYSESIESSSIVDIKNKYENFIGGDFVSPLSKKYLDTISPSTEEKLAKIPLSINLTLIKLFKQLKKI